MEFLKYRVKFSIISMFIVSIFILTSCSNEPLNSQTSSSGTSSGSVDIGIVLPSTDLPRWIQDETRFKQALINTPYEAEILFSQDSSARERENVETLITKGMKVLIISPFDSVGAVAAAEAAKNAGVTVISYDRLINNTDAVDYYVTFNSFEVGKAMGQYLIDNASGTSNPLYIYTGHPGDNNAFIFFEGAWSVLQPKIEDGTFVIQNSLEAVSLQDKNELTREEKSRIIGQTTTNWIVADARNLAEANLTSAAHSGKGDVYVLAPNDGTAIAISDTFAQDPEITNVIITGQDAEKSSVQYIIDSKQSMTVFKDVRLLVVDAIDLAVSILEGQAPQTSEYFNNGVIDVPSIETEITVVDRSDVVSKLIDSGFYEASDFDLTGLQ